MVLGAAILVWKTVCRSEPADLAASSLQRGIAPMLTDEHSVKMIIQWLFLSALGAAGLLSFTSYITADITPLPLLWVLPLSIYLLTFVIAFGHSQFKTGWLTQSWIPLLVAEPICMNISPGAVLAINMALLLVLCLATNIELVVQNQRLPVCQPFIWPLLLVAHWAALWLRSWHRCASNLPAIETLSFSHSRSINCSNTAMVWEGGELLPEL